MSDNLLSAPYGTWNSPISAEAITKNANSYEDVLVDSVTGLVYHLERRPSEKGRTVLVATATRKDVVGAQWNVRTAVQEYGGSPALVHGGIAYFSNFADGRVYKLKLDDEGGAVGEPEAVTPADKPYRYANLAIFPSNTTLLVSVLEDHTIDAPSDVVTTLCLINTATQSIETTQLISGADFYALPRFSPDGNKFAWMQWSHPDMPWNGAEVHIGDVQVNGTTLEITNRKHIAGQKEKISACYPLFSDSNTLLFTSDESGFVNPWVYEVEQGKSAPLLAKPIDEDFAKPFWVLGEFPYAVLGNVVVLTAIRDGRDVVYFVDINDPNHAGGHDAVCQSLPLVVTSSIRATGDANSVVFIGGTGDEKKAIYTLSVQGKLDKFPLPALSSTEEDGESKLPKEIVSTARPITLNLGGDGPLHVVFYPPHNPAYSGTSLLGEKPPCIINVHGGPTSYVPQGLDWRKQYFTSRGWAWVDVNYRGSSGYGRDYISRLDGSWGLVDVQDCIEAVKHLSGKEYALIDPKRCTIRGGSAGGYTTLAALSVPVKKEDRKVFAAAQSSYGISDLKKLEEFTHKFESRYLERLMIGERAGRNEEEVQAALEDVYKKRSPIYFVDHIEVPLLILQGEIDKVVPKEQAELIYDRLKAKGGVVDYKLYAGEGHGWRQEANLRDSLEREREFYEKVLGLKAE